MNQKIAILISIGMLALFFTPSVFAAVSVSEARGALKENRKEFKEEKKEFASEQGQLKEQIREDLREKNASRVGILKSFFGARAVLNKAKITVKNASSLTVEQDGKTYTVTIDDKTRLRRRFFGGSTLDEFQVGNEVNVTGKFTDDGHTAILATLIRNLSIQKRFGVFVGDVTVVNGNDITINTVHRGTQKATVDTKTKFVGRKGLAIKQSDVLVGHKVQIKGMWDSSNNTLSEVTYVKDFSLPPVATRAATPTGTN